MSWIDNCQEAIALSESDNKKLNETFTFAGFHIYKYGTGSEIETTRILPLLENENGILFRIAVFGGVYKFEGIPNFQDIPDEIFESFMRGYILYDDNLSHVRQKSKIITDTLNWANTHGKKE